MAKRKSSEDLESERMEKQKRNSVHEHHREMKAKLAKLQADRATVLEVQQTPAVATILSRFSKDVEQSKEMLVYAEKKDVEGIQHSVRARRDLLNILAHAYESDLSEARAQIREFETANALFLAADEDGVVEEQEAEA